MKTRERRTMKPIRTCLYLALAAAALTAPAADPLPFRAEADPAASDGGSASTPAAPAAVAASPPAGAVITGITNSDYVLTPDDVVSISVFREPDLATQSRIASDGKVQLPLLGDVPVAGLTLRKARTLITQLYDADYLVEPQVYLSVVAYAQVKFTVLGQVAKPGSYQIGEGERPTVLEAIALAGGFTRIANRAKVEIKREGASGKPIRINAKDLDAKSGGAFLIESGDVISVAEGWF